LAQPIGQRFTAIGAKISLCWQVAAGEFRPADILKRHANPIIRLPLPRYRLTNEFTPIAFPSFDLLDGHDQPSALSPLRNTENWSTSSDSLVDATAARLRGRSRAVEIGASRIHDPIVSRARGLGFARDLSRWPRF